MVQHILLIGVAAPLLALARPWMRMWRGFPRSSRRAVARRGLRPGLAAAAAGGGDPGGGAVSWLIFNLNFCAWHLPGLYDAALRWELVHALEHLTFFATALLFWTRVVPSPPWRSPLGEPAKLAYLASTLVVGWVLAIVLALATSPLYSAYAAEASRPGGISALHRPAARRRGDVGAGLARLHDRDRRDRLPLAGAPTEAGRANPPKPLPTGVG